jgi:hypothetical protein
MSDAIEAADARRQFKEDVRLHVQDLSLLCKWVLVRTAFPIPEPDLFTAGLYSVMVSSAEEFERYSALLAADGPVAWDEGEHHRSVRKYFGTASLEVYLSRRAGDPAATESQEVES